VYHAGRVGIVSIVEVRTLGDLWDMPEGVADLYEALRDAEERAGKRTLQEELKDEQLSWAQETLGNFADLVSRVDGMRVADIRRELKEIMSENLADF